MESLSEAGTSSPVQSPATHHVDLEPLDDTIVAEEEEEEEEENNETQFLNNNIDRRKWPCPRCKFNNDGDAGYCENTVDGKRCCSAQGPSTTIGWVGTRLANPEHLSWKGFLSPSQIQSLHKSSQVRLVSEARTASPVQSPATSHVVLEPLVDAAITVSASPSQTPTTTSNASWRKIWTRTTNASLLTTTTQLAKFNRNFSSPSAENHPVVLLGDEYEVDKVRGAKKHMREEDVEYQRPEEIESEGDKSEVDVVRVTKKSKLEKDMESLSEAGTSRAMNQVRVDTIVTKEEEEKDMPPLTDLTHVVTSGKFESCKGIKICADEKSIWLCLISDECDHKMDQTQTICFRKSQVQELDSYNFIASINTANVEDEDNEWVKYEEQCWECPKCWHYITNDAGLCINIVEGVQCWGTKRCVI